MSSQSCIRRPGGRHAAPCHSWHGSSVESVTVGAVRAFVGLSPAVPLSAPDTSGRHCAEAAEVGTAVLYGLAA